MIIPFIFCLLLVSCSEDETSSDFQPGLTGGVQMKKYDTFGDVTTNLFKFANETVIGMYPVSFQAEKTRQLNKTELMTWIKKNESNKSAKINRGNRKILGRLLEQNIIQAILITTDQKKPFKEAVYVLIPEKYRLKGFINTGAILITDAASHTQSGAAGSDEEEEIETEEPCYAQSGTYIDATNVQTSGSSLSGCPPCLVECVECDDPLVGEDCIWCQV